MVQSNVDFQVVGVILHSKIKGATSLADCLERFKSFSLQWAPKQFLVDVSEPIFAALESVFPGISLLSVGNFVTFLLDWFRLEIKKNIYLSFLISDLKFKNIS